MEADEIVSQIDYTREPLDLSHNKILKRSFDVLFALAVLCTISL